LPVWRSGTTKSVFVIFIASPPFVSSEERVLGIDPSITGVSSINGEIYEVGKLEIAVYNE
jgi:hypothetical protein